MRRGKPIPKKVRDEVRERSGGICEAKFSSACERRGYDFHHLKKKSQTGGNSPINIIYICRPCHDAIEQRRPGYKRFHTYPWQQEGERAVDY